MTTKRVLQGVAGLAAVAALAAGGVALSSGSDNNSAAASGNATGATSTPYGAPPGGGRMMGRPATGTAAAKAKAAALAKYPGTAERVMQNPSGAYVVHVIKSDGTEVHVLVSSAFKVTGVQTGGPPRGAYGQAPPPGSSSSSPSGTSS
jgi:hypothetical protein